jgi:uncharacterized membrane protein
VSGKRQTRQPPPQPRQNGSAAPPGRDGLRPVADRPQPPARQTPQAPAGPAVSLSRFELEAYRGPLPHPAVLRQYDEVIPGFAREYADSFIRQGKHRQRLEWVHLLNGIIRSYLGLLAGFIVVLVFGYWSVQLIREGHEVSGTLFGTVDLAALAGVFIYGYQKVAEDLRDKRQRMEQLKPPAE